MCEKQASVFALQEGEDERSEKAPSWAARARDIGLMSFYLEGIPFGNLTSIKVEHLKNDRCTYRINKTQKMVS